MSSHRLELALDAIQSQLAARNTAGVSRLRVDTLDDQFEVPQYIISMGPDELLDEESRNVATLDMLATVYVDIVIDRTTPDIDAELLRHRREVHIGMSSSARLGLSFVIDVQPLGSDDPDVIDDDELSVAYLRTNWAIRYRHSVGDPAA